MVPWFTWIILQQISSQYASVPDITSYGPGYNSTLIDSVKSFDSVKRFEGLVQNTEVSKSNVKMCRDDILAGCAPREPVW